MTGKYIQILLFMAASFSCTVAASDTTFSLTDSQKKIFEETAASFPVFSCDSLPLSKAVKNMPDCLMAKHLYPFAKWIASKDKTFDVCYKELIDRQKSFSVAQRFAIDLSGVTIGGDPAAPVTIVLYLSGLCPLCKKIGCELYREVTEGKLKGHARLVVKPCKSAPADQALLAAAHFKKPWEFLFALNALKNRPDEPDLIKLADKLGVDSAQFRTYCNTRELQSVLERNALEATRNGVTYTPTIFINERRNYSYTDPKWVVDAALYEYEILKHPAR